ncbi:MAG: M23 family metallopeptidase [Xanthomonadales bacterium]|nr:M23 family metallopeptidase [Xanthomonadales bacterium]
MKPLILLSASLLLPTVASASQVTAQQGGVARWAEPKASACGFMGERYPAIDGTCFYPVDFQAKTGIHEIALYDEDGVQHLGSLRVLPTDFPEVEIELDDDRLVTLEGEDRTRHGEERQAVLSALSVSADQPQFELPLEGPVASIPASEDDFGSERIFNGKATSHHTGRDAPVSVGTPLHAVADGTVVLAADHLLTGKAVYVDHGGGLVSMLFHLSELDVPTGDEVKQGQVLGKVGSTGRSTGPHMHLGLRWMDQRIDPYLLLEDPEQLPSVADTRAEATAKIEEAEEMEPAEG